MRRAIIHIGSSKAGSTSIQHALYSNRLQLLEHGFYYPKTGVFAGFGHANVGRDIVGAADFRSNKGTFAELLKEIASNDHQTIVLSTETLIRANADARHKLITGFHEAGIQEVSVIVYVREQAAMVHSLYGELVRNGNFRATFQEFAIRQINRPFYDYTRLLDQLRGQYGVDNVIMVPFDVAHLSGDLISDYLERIGYPNASNFAPGLNPRLRQRKNRGLPAQRLEAMRSVDAFLHRHRINRKLLQLRRWFNFYDRLFAIDPSSFMTPRLESRIRDRFDESNRRLAGALFGNEAIELFPNRGSLATRSPVQQKIYPK